ncbi:MAG: hypothetical protein JXA18_06580 [Chitinispirillaceae bacterium]|nr:hypothetical protein [Chitinispirillaceae bacterium]
MLKRLLFIQIFQQCVLNVRNSPCASLPASREFSEFIRVVVEFLNYFPPCLADFFNHRSLEYFMRQFTHFLVALDAPDTDIYRLKNSIREDIASQSNRAVDLAREKYLRPYARESILKEAVFV